MHSREYQLFWGKIQEILHKAEELGKDEDDNRFKQRLCKVAQVELQKEFCQTLFSLGADSNIPQQERINLAKMVADLGFNLDPYSEQLSILRSNVSMACQLYGRDLYKSNKCQDYYGRYRYGSHLRELYKDATAMRRVLAREGNIYALEEEIRLYAPNGKEGRYPIKHRHKLLPLYFTLFFELQVNQFEMTPTAERTRLLTEAASYIRWQAGEEKSPYTAFAGWANAMIRCNRLSQIPVGLYRTAATSVIGELVHKYGSAEAKDIYENGMRDTIDNAYKCSNYTRLPNPLDGKEFATWKEEQEKKQMQEHNDLFLLRQTHNNLSVTGLFRLHPRSGNSIGINAAGACAAASAPPYAAPSAGAGAGARAAPPPPSFYALSLLPESDPLHAEPPPPYDGDASPDLPSYKAPSARPL